MSASQKRHGPETQVRRRKGWQLGAFALGLAILAYAVSSAFDGASTFYSNLGSLSQSRGLLESDSQDRDALLGTAASHFQEALRWNPENSRAFHNLGLIALSQGQKLTAQAAFEKAVDLAPGSRLSHHHLAMLYYDLGLEDKAIDAWQRAGAAAWLVREGLRCRQEYDENCAERFYKLALQVEPGYYNALYFLGMLYADQGRNASAAESYREALGSASLPPERYHLIQARIYALEGRWDEAIASFKKVIELDPLHADAHGQIAAILDVQFHDLEGATEWSLAAISVDPRRPGPYLRLGRIYQDLQEYGQAELWYQQALAVAGSNRGARARAQAGIGRCALAQGHLEEAVSAIKGAVDTEPDKATYHVLLGDIYAQMGRHELAASSYQVALELDPDNGRAQRQLEALGKND